MTVDFRHGDAAAVPFEAHSFDLVVCQAAFKNFTEPVCALDEMHRVLRPGGTAIIHDLSKDAANADIDREVNAMKLSRFNALATRMVLETVLRRRAYTPAQFQHLIAESAFRTCDIRKDGIGLEVRLKRPSLEKAIRPHGEWLYTSLGANSVSISIDYPMYLLADFGPRLHIGSRIDCMFEAITQLGGVYDSRSP